MVQNYYCSMTAGSKGKVLLMDDEQIILDVTLEVLKFLNYEVHFARNGEEALNLYAQEKAAGAPFDVVILDLSVPEGMGGREAVGRLRELDPLVKAVVSSGFANDPAMADFQSFGFAGRLAKPYKIQDMKALLEALIRK